MVRLRSIEDAACLAGLLTNGARHLMGVEPVAQAVLAVVMNVQKVPDRCPYHVSALVYDTPEQSRVLVSRDSQDLFAVSGAGAEALALKIADEIRKVQSLDPAAVKAWYAANG